MGTVDVTADTVAVGEKIAKSVEKEESEINLASNSVNAHRDPTVPLLFNFSRTAFMNNAR